MAVPITATTCVMRLLANSPMMSGLRVKIKSDIIGSGGALACSTHTKMYHRLHL